MATVDQPGVAWVHGTRIGIARSDDALAWRFAGTAEGLELGDGDGVASGETHWAPEVIDDGERYRMYLTVIDGIFGDPVDVPVSGIDALTGDRVDGVRLASYVWALVLQR